MAITRLKAAAYESQIAEMDEDSSGKRRTTKSRKWTAKTTRSEPLLGASIMVFGMSVRLVL